MLLAFGRYDLIGRPPKSACFLRISLPLRSALLRIIAQIGVNSNVDRTTAMYEGRRIGGRVFLGQDGARLSGALCGNSEEAYIKKPSSWQTRAPARRRSPAGGSAGEPDFSRAGDGT